MNKQLGFTLTEIMIAVGVISALVIGGMNFYNNAVAKAQANEAMTAGKLVMDNVIDYFARFNSLPVTNGNLAHEYIPNGYSHVQIAKWYKGTNLIESDEWGYVEVELASLNIQAGIAGKVVRFYTSVSDNLSFLEYHGCRTDILSGAFDGVDLPTGGEHADRSPILPECGIGLLDQASTVLPATPST